MKTTLLLALLGAAAVGCASASNDDGASSTSNAVSGPVASTSLAPGKYVIDGKILMIYDACSTQNFLGDAAKGAVDGNGVIHAEEGDICNGYKLETVGAGEIKVTWDRDPTAHLDGASIASCVSNEGTYLMMQESPFVAPKPGTYAKAGSSLSLVFAAGCAIPAVLSSDSGTLATGTTDEDHPVGYLATVEGDVCLGYTYTAKANGTVTVTWAPPSDASISHDATVATDCKALEGVYAAH